MVDGLRPWGAALSGPVDAAMRTVPRHVFVPGVSLERAYGPDPVVTHRDGEGVPVSSASAPGTVAGMLEKLDVRPGQRVLEIGAGTGYNAALLAQLVGPTGSVTTIEYDEAVASAARAALSGLGVAVTVVHGDGMLGAPGQPTFDRIVVTAGAWDIPRAWWQQLAEDGRLVVPLRILGLTRTVVFERAGAVLRSRSVMEDGFMPMRGVGAVREQNISVGPGPDLVVRLDDERAVDASALQDALDHPAAVCWTGVAVAWGWTEHLDFWLATLEGFCRLLVSRAAVDDGRLMTPKGPWGSMGLVEGGTLAYLTTRPGPTEDAAMPTYEIGACGYGPRGADLAARLAERVRDWDRDGGQGVQLWIEAHPGSAGRPEVSGVLLAVDKRDSRVLVLVAEQAAAAV
ncbi:Protein-L-isoaspartate(D-aspartate) O-methyltransferase [Pseudofrankia inefficax]|uniref:Protein-L-isoaspartate O-methyltransferase n=2 Tax=Pseudofrankia inefficax (strain DSM 45817 / CECT 9037 / DDB 130130 / EuI1c) TaxID=298654 RepID=E3IWB4_PSEI1|nr:Protein-L-isoaspartate(D-aspartate) O-methyltransferase [Pseudofrankia inefficax]